MRVIVIISDSFRNTRIETVTRKQYSMKKITNIMTAPHIKSKQMDVDSIHIQIGLFHLALKVIFGAVLTDEQMKNC